MTASFSAFIMVCTVKHTKIHLARYRTLQTSRATIPVTEPAKNYRINITLLILRKQNSPIDRFLPFIICTCLFPVCVVSFIAFF